ncbi:excinuclease ABC subunit A [Candidatus Wolfebacteria bacterium]|nr:MAG: excinuclease ABC subunit A [Candidatus Wolfebacteria bacterium]
MSKQNKILNEAGKKIVKGARIHPGTNVKKGTGQVIPRSDDVIAVKGARTHNLKNIDVSMPRNKMIVFTGLSGSGKSSLAFDTIFAEGQRRYVESLSSYARQFLKQMAKPDVDEILGLSPAISIDQKSRSNNPRSTVATITEIYDYLRVLYSRIGKAYCLECGDQIHKLSHQEIVSFVKEKIQTFKKKTKGMKKVMGVEFDDTRIKIYSPVVRGRKGEYYQLLYDLLGKGFTTVRIDGVEKNLRDRIELSKHKKHDIDILVDEYAIHEFQDDPKDTTTRLSEAVETAINESDGLVKVAIVQSEASVSKKEKKTAKAKKSKDTLTEEFIMSAKFSCARDGFSYPEIEPRLFSFNSPAGACEYCNGLGTKHLFGTDACDSCNGNRLREEALHVFLGEEGKIQKNIVELTHLSIEDAHSFLKNFKLTAKEKSISNILINEIQSRLNFMLNVGLDYISLDRRANTLSGGEAQRIRLASQLGSRLVGALYVLDEPTIGLHQRDNERLIKTLQDLRDLGNTIIVVEHDEDTIYSSDYIIDIGPKAGVHGGEIIASDYLDTLLTADKNTTKSRTLAYLRDEVRIEVPESRREKNKGHLSIEGGKIFNIDNIKVDIPLGRLNCITGVSGSGKSSFLYEILNKNLRSQFDRKYRSNMLFNCSSFKGTEYVSRSILINQSPIGRTPRSNVSTYTGAFTFIREIFAETEESRLRGWKANRFSFNVKGGRCEACNGNGEIAVEMHFLPTVYVTCDVCGGKRFNKETLSVKYKNKNIYEVLKMTVEDGLEFFNEIPAISDRLKTLVDVGLGYIELGQKATTLSGGEAQRVKIASELYRPLTQKTVYLLDEPTVGLHYDDVANLIGVLNRLVERGNTVVVIEHSMDLIKSADYVIDFGPEGGSGGGKIVAKGTPEEVANNPKSHTGKYLRKILKRS